MVVVKTELQRRNAASNDRTELELQAVTQEQHTAPGGRVVSLAGRTVGAVPQNALLQVLVQHGVGIVTDGIFLRDAGALLGLEPLAITAVHIWSPAVLAIPVGVVGAVGLLLAHTFLALEDAIVATVRNVTRDTLAILLMIPVRTVGLFCRAAFALEFVPFVSWLGALGSGATDTFIVSVVSPIWAPGFANKALAFAQNTVRALGLYVGDAVAIRGHG